MVLETTGEHDKGEGPNRTDIEAVTGGPPKLRQNRNKVTIGLSLLVWGSLQKFNRGLDLKILMNMHS